MSGERRIHPSDPSPLRAVRPAIERYRELFPPCATDNCYEIADTRSAYCDRCSSNREFEARMASMRAAWEAGR